jgi:hypothetical protein
LGSNGQQRRPADSRRGRYKSQSPIESTLQGA